MSFSQFRRALGVVCVLASAVPACSATPDTPPAGVLRIGVREPATLLPADLRDQAGRLIVGALWTPLFDYDAPTGKLTPRAAESATSADRLTWLIRLRGGGRFHDGTPVTANSYVDTWRAVAAQRWPGSTALTETLRAKDISAPDESTIQIVLDRPFGQVPAVLAAPALLPLPASVLSAQDWSSFSRAPVGNGPFRMTQPWRRGSGARLTRFGTAPPGTAREVELTVGEPGAQYDAVRDGTLDLVGEVPANRHEAMHTDFAQAHLTWPLPQVTYLGFPLSDNRFHDATARYAVALAIDRTAIEAGPLGHQADPARALLPPAVAPGKRSGTCRPCTHDPKAARSLLDQSGLTGQTTIYHDQSQQPWAKSLASQLHDALGLDVTTKQRPPDAPRPTDGPFTITRTLATPSPHELLTAIATATGYTDQGFTQLLAAADTATQQDSGRHYRLAENQLLRDLPAAPLWSAHGHAVWAQRVQHVTATPFRGIELPTITVPEQ